MDIVALLIIVVCAVDGLMRGFIISLFSMAGFFIAIIVAKLLSPAAVGFITAHTGIDEAIGKWLSSKAAGFNSTIQPVLKILGKSEAIQPDKALTAAIILFIAFIIIFILAKLLIMIVARVLNATAKLPVIKQFNKLGGLIFGLVKGVLFLYIIFAILTLIIPVLPSSSPIVTAIDKSIFAAGFYKYNIIIPWISGAGK
jgi:uncharacterized membrane protein required for colicin V production